MPLASAKPAAGEGAPVVKPTIKKETVRIDVPAASKVPQATVKIQAAPVPAKIPDAKVRTVPALVASTSEDDELVGATTEDPAMMYIALGVLFFALVTFASQLMTFLAN